MSVNIPYLMNAASLDNALNKMKSAATPANFNNDFVETKLQIKGGSGRALPPFFKKIGLVGSDGAPTSLYQLLRNPATSEAAVAEAMKIGFRALYEINEYAHDLSDSDFKGLVVQITGLEPNNRTVQAIVTTFTRLKKHANFDVPLEAGPLSLEKAEKNLPPHDAPPRQRTGLGLNLGYTINLNLPPSTNIDVFNAIFKSLKENLLSE